jgi:acyl-CoA reductase-like NAD-dependent aldehyde dehydrogenase
VKDAREKGATIVTGGNRIERDGTWYEPTLVTGVTPDMEIYIEETFGPVIPVVKVKDEEEAIRLANDHQYGLNGSVWSKDTKRAIELASRMECGQVTVNDVVLSVGNPVLPFGGVKSSGIGRYHGPEGLLGFTHQKAIMVDKGWGNKEPFWFPYEGKYGEMVSAFKSLLSGNLPKALLSLLKLRGMTD